jgi:hypothetical protein
MFCVTVATSATSGQGRPRQISTASPDAVSACVSAVANFLPVLDQSALNYNVQPRVSQNRHPTAVVATDSRSPLQDR